MLAPGCTYDLTSSWSSNEGILVGAEATVNSYFWHDQCARQLFDHVEYNSAVETVSGTAAVIRFTDILEKNGQRHTYHCRQRVVVEASGPGTIKSIVHEDIKQEAEAVQAFMHRVGVTL